MIRKIIKIDEEKCTGCGACAEACHEGAIEMVGGKAKLTRENYCDGFGDCLPECPAGAISFEEREAPAYDEAAVLASKQAKEQSHAAHAGGCPGSAVRNIEHATSGAASSQLRQWPCQIRLAPVAAPFFDGAKLLIAADCTAYAYANFHSDFMRGRITLIGCPKLDSFDYAEKLCEILKRNSIKSIEVARMEVPCCGGLEAAVRRAILASGKKLSLRVVTVSIDGRTLD